MITISPTKNSPNEGRKAVQVILDANFLLAPGEVGVDIFEEMENTIDKKYDLIMPEPVKVEIQNLSGGNGEEAKAAKIALMLMERNDVEVLGTDKKTGDASIVELVREVETPVVATNDKNLRNQFRERSIPTLYVRTGDHVELEGDIK